MTPHDRARAEQYVDELLQRWHEQHQRLDEWRANHRIDAQCLKALENEINARFDETLKAEINGILEDQQEDEDLQTSARRANLANDRKEIAWFAECYAIWARRRSPDAKLAQQDRERRRKGGRAKTRTAYQDAAVARATDLREQNPLAKPNFIANKILKEWGKKPLLDSKPVDKPSLPARSTVHGWIKHLFPPQ